MIVVLKVMTYCFESILRCVQNQETIRELEDQIQTLKHALQDSGQQRTRELRVREIAFILLCAFVQ